MALKIIDDDCRMKDGKYVVVVEGDNPEEVMSHKAKKLAINKAEASGYSKMGISGQSGSFPVTSDASATLVTDWTKFARDGKITGYRNEFKLSGGF